eukprot:TRINITY_DN7730_c0_g1_i2.p1 TRINITY_DN7730_c0_g1~~TRINITY_DN7730_c0_g1_i2.p1  ORF type:complete len:456 (+),score=52.00 TRINITY_DN7730_c0_g1_i2:59-1426(+)
MVVATPGETTLLLNGAQKSSWCAPLLLVLVGGGGFLADGYDFSSIDLVMGILEDEYPDQLVPWKVGLITSMTFAGTLLGMLLFGILGDIVGRKPCSIATALMTAGGALLSAGSVQSKSFPIEYQLVLWRCLLGIGIGGEYPISMAIMSECKSSSSFQGVSGTPFQFLLYNCLMFSSGSLLTPVVVLAAMPSMNPDLVWRLALGAGAVPSIIALPARLLMEEGEAVKQARRTPEDGYAAPHSIGATLRDILKMIGPKWVTLLGLCLAWNFDNMISYGLSSFKHLVSKDLFSMPSNTSWDDAYQAAYFSLYYNSVQVVARVFLALFIVSPTVVSQQGSMFLGLFACAALCGVFIKLDASSFSLVALLGLFASINTIISVFVTITPALHFSPSARSTAIGIAAASGKAGALISTLVTPMIEDAWGLHVVLFVFSFVALVGCFVSWSLIPPVEGDYMMK